MTEYVVLIVGDAERWWTTMSEQERLEGYGAAAPYALLLVLISIPATVLLMRQERLDR